MNDKGDGQRSGFSVGCRTTGRRGRKRRWGAEVRFPGLRLHGHDLQPESIYELVVSGQAFEQPDLW